MNELIMPPFLQRNVSELRRFRQAPLTTTPGFPRQEEYVPWMSRKHEKKIWINHGDRRVFSFWNHRIYVYLHFKKINTFSAGIVFRRQNLRSTDVTYNPLSAGDAFKRIHTVFPQLKFDRNWTNMHV